MSVTVTPVRDKRDLAQFLRIPYRIYGKNHPQYVHPLIAQMKAFLDPKKNPFFRHADTQLWVARDGAIPVGRIAACVDASSNEYHDELVGFFGFYEAPDDPEVARALLTTAANWIKDQGMATMRGPGCFTTNHDYLGLLIDGYERRPVLGMPWQPPYYRPQFEQFGLVKAKDLLAWDFRVEGNRMPERMAQFAERFESRKDFTIRGFRMDRFWEEVEIVRGLYYDAWKDNWGFVPLDEEEFRHLAKDMKSMVDPGLLLIAERDGEPIGFSMSTQDFNEALKPLNGALLPFGWLRFLLAKRHIKGCRTLLLGVKPEHRQRGVDTLLVYESIRYGLTRGYDHSEASWILEDNVAMNRALEKQGAKVKNIYRIFEKDV
ncbi:MAG: GNAT family N-acetyltransferase [Candidatus Krumholzibacteriia bacterium]